MTFPTGLTGSHKIGLKYNTDSVIQEVGDALN